MYVHRQKHAPPTRHIRRRLQVTVLFLWKSAV